MSDIVERSTSEEIAARMRQTYDACGDRWFKLAAEEIDRLQAINAKLMVAFETAHGALLCIGGTDSNWSEYARRVADDTSYHVIAKTMDTKDERPT
jgi:hypothetical protein